MIQQTDIPPGWAECTLGDVAKWGSGGTPSRKRADYFSGDIPWIKTGELGRKYVRDAEEKITEEAIQNSSAKIFPKGSVGIAMYGATIGKTSIWGIDASTNQACAVAQCHADVIISDYLYYLLHAEKRHFVRAGKGGAQPNISQTLLKDWSIWLPPLNEQRRIVAKLEALFSELEAGTERLRTARAQLKTYRQAILKHAFEGKLTADWRTRHAATLEPAETLLKRIQQEREAHYQQQFKDWQSAVQSWEATGKEGKKPSKPKKPKQLEPFDEEELSKIPQPPSEHWSWQKLDKICAHDQYAVKAGPFGSALKKEFYVPDGYKIYGQEQVISGDPYYGDYFVNQEKYDELASCKIASGDVLISLVGTVGKVLVLPDNCRPGIINPRLIKVSLNRAHYRPKFFKYYFESAFVRGLYKTLAKGTTMDVLNLTIIQSLPFPICSLQEQDQIVAEIESQFSLIDDLECTIDTELHKAESLRQSILKAAFAGKLAAQDPADEPASTLLARIREAKANQPKPKRKTKSTKRSAA